MRYILSFFALVFAGSLSLGQSFEEDNQKFRDHLNNDFRDPSKSPLEEVDLKEFKEIPFFELNSRYKVKGIFTPETNPRMFRMETTTSRKPLYTTYGTIEFELDGSLFVLEVYQNQELKKQEGYEDYLFIPFTDETNGESTYGGGRYLEFRIPANDSVYLDFNKAYNPYCAYSQRYSCPIVPSRNHIAAKIEAGVKYDEH